MFDLQKDQLFIWPRNNFTDINYFCFVKSFLNELTKLLIDEQNPGGRLQKKCLKTSTSPVFNTIILYF